MTSDEARARVTKILAAWARRWGIDPNEMPGMTAFEFAARVAEAKRVGTR